MSGALAKAPALCAVQYRLQQLGWDIDALDVDMPGGAVRICLRNGPVRVTFDARGGRASTTRERYRTEPVPMGRRGDRYISDRLIVDFMGRQRHADLRDGLRWLSEYVTHNGRAARLPHRADEVFLPLLAVEGAR